MLVWKRIIVILLGMIFFTSSASATSVQFGVTLPILIKTKDPTNVHGYRAVIWYQPQSLVWKKVNIYFAAGYGHWWVGGSGPNRIMNIFAIAPVIRYIITKTTYFTPYLEASIGASYLSSTRFDDRNLGIHYAFQDELGVGAKFGKSQRFFATLSALHYSNGSMSAYNAGITVPLILNVGYQLD